MISWHLFAFFAFPFLLLLALGACLAWSERHWPALLSTGLGVVVMAIFIVGLWMSLERPPLRTMGETRLWYAFFMPVAGMVTYARWRYKWIFSFSTLMSIVFVVINLLKPEIHNKTLMPALQSVWFAPHVIVYMFAYALLGAATMMALPVLFPSISSWVEKRRKGNSFDSARWQEAIDNLVNSGLAFITIGMLFGALWAKEAWGHYWSWDPKETWAAATWMLYLLFIHVRLSHNESPRWVFWLLVIAFICLQVCWWGINYLPSAQGLSIHTYNMD